jgi:formate dehydrogenase iron-sulfur subunit
MGRAKFLVERWTLCECNACVTTCKNEHRSAVGINRRKVVTINDSKPGERSISVAVATVPAPLYGCGSLLDCFLSDR